MVNQPSAARRRVGGYHGPLGTINVRAGSPRHKFCPWSCWGSNQTLSESAPATIPCRGGKKIDASCRPDGVTGQGLGLGARFPAYEQLG
jgi:hypothetical protein